MTIDNGIRIQFLKIKITKLLSDAGNKNVGKFEMRTTKVATGL